MITDFVTGREMPNIGAEENRQAVARFLVNEKGYSKDDLEVDVKIELAIAGEQYGSQVDLAVRINGGRLRIISGATCCSAISICVRASNGSRSAEDSNRKTQSRR